MGELAIKAQNLGKAYSIGSSRSGELRHSIGNKLRSLIKPDASKKEEFWALKEISFDIKQGEAVGIVGRNGAGKSTLLKLLSRITDPSTGRFEINGRVSSLLEVGTGFHPELSGRENIFLNGTILGMTRAEIKSKFDEIIDFSGVEKFIETPVKHYSSGMKVRLAFSVAAHLEPEILIVDEVLAVGDADFQKKCLGKMDEVSKEGGRTVFFVSHNLAAVSSLCNRGMLLEKGRLIEDAEVNDVIRTYVSRNRSNTEKDKLINLDHRKGEGHFIVEQIKILNKDKEYAQIVKTGEEVIFEVFLNRKVNKNEGAFRIDFAIDTEQDMRIAWFSSQAINNSINPEFDRIYLKIPKFQFGRGTYYLTFYATMNGALADYIHQGFAFEVEEGDFFGTGKIIPKTQTFIYTDHQISSN
ncbi:MAG: ABC transporter ATP-binding protein [Cytophagales bacterium]